MSSISKPFHYVDATDLTSISLDDALRAKQDGVYCPEPTLRQYKRGKPAFVDNPQGQSGFDGLGDAEIIYPPTFMTSSRDATIYGYRTIVNKDQKLFNDDAIGKGRMEAYVRRLGEDSNAFFNEDTRLRYSGESYDLIDLAPQASVIDVSGCIISLCSHEPSNYGSFIFRLMPKLFEIRQLGLIENSKFLAYPASKTTMECLGMLGLSPQQIVPHNPRLRYRCEHVLAPSMRNNQAFLDPETKSLVGDLRLRFGTKQVRGKKVYISRYGFGQSGLSMRRMMNELALIERLSRAGFMIYSPEEDTMLGQIKTFSSAEMVVGPSGSAMFNSVFCWPGTKLIDIESENWWLHAHTCLFSSSELEYGILVGAPDPNDDNAVHRRWTVDIDALMDRLSRFGRLQGSGEGIVPDDMTTVSTQYPTADHEGADFHTVLQSVHNILRPRSYLEIGTCTGASLSLATCKSIAVDPLFQLDCNVVGKKPACMLFQMGSDDFFRDLDPVKLLGQPIDLAFLDGMHHFEFLLRDFYNTEKSCRRNSVIFLHDCIPTDLHVARRRVDDQSLISSSSHPTWWAGDLWKAVELIQKYRPELKITAYNAPPTGLIAVTNLDPSSHALELNYAEMIEEARNWKLDQAALKAYQNKLSIDSTSALMSLEQIASRFWL